MANLKTINISDEAIATLGLKLTDKHVSDQLDSNSRVFEYPHLDDVFIMESDLYGNVMPNQSCFLAFHGKNGLMGKHLTIEKLMGASVDDVRHMVDANVEG
jgi:hypothetical protein